MIFEKWSGLEVVSKSLEEVCVWSRRVERQNHNECRVEE